MDTAQWPQEIVVKAMDEIIVPNTCPNGSTNKKSCSTALERKVRPQKEQALNCPRCNSTNTKFCYYNNYSLTQPRYFCKTCRRYWTEGGSLRSIPVGGGSRKNKRSSSSSTTTSNILSSSISTDHLIAQSLLNSNPKFPNHHHHQGQDLNLGFPQNHNHGHNTQQEFRTLSEFIQLPTIEIPTKTQIPNSSASALTTSANLSALELLNGITSSRGGLTPFMPMPMPVPGSDPNVVYTSGFPLHDFKPTLNFSLDSLTNHIHGYSSLQGGVQQEEANNNGRLLFPFQDLKSVPSNTSNDLDNNITTTATTITTSTSTTTTTNTATAIAADQLSREQGNPSGYWTGLLGSTAGASW